MTDDTAKTLTEVAAEEQRDGANGQVDVADEPETLVEPANLTVLKGYRAELGTIEFTGRWKGLYVTANVNPKRRVWRMLSENETVDEALCEVITDHNLPDEEGDGLPVPLTEDALGELPHLLYVAVLREYVALVNKAGRLPKR